VAFKFYYKFDWLFVEQFFNFVQNDHFHTLPGGGATGRPMASEGSLEKVLGEEKKE